MKKLLIACAAVLLCLGLLLGGMLLFGRVTITAQEKIYPVGTEEITVVWRNWTAKSMFYGEPFSLEAWVGGEWVPMEPVNDLLFYLPAYGLLPGLNQKITYSTGFYYGPLQAGRYRIAANYHYESEVPISEATPRHDVYAEFEVK